MKVGICQFDISWENKQKNKDRIQSLLVSCKNDLDWIIFPEMTLTGFSMDMHKTQLLEIDISFFRNIASEYLFFVSFGSMSDDCNKIITFDRNGEIINYYSKVHLFSHSGEDKIYLAGERTTSFKLNGFNITPFICYDLRFPYLFWSKAYVTDVFVVIANWPLSRIKHWTTLLEARAIENLAYVIGVNRIGESPNEKYCGNSLIIDPFGNKVLDCGDKEGIFSVEINKQLVTEIRNKFSFLNDRKNTIAK